MVGCDHRSDREAKAGTTSIRHLKVTLTQVRLNACIEQQANALLTHRPKRPLACSKTIEPVALHVVNAGVTPVERCPIHHIGMGDQAAAGGCQQASTGQSITGKSPDLATDACRHHQQRGQGRTHH